MKSPATKRQVHLEFLECENTKNISKNGTVCCWNQKGSKISPVLTKVHKSSNGNFCSKLYFKKKNNNSNNKILLKFCICYYP